MPIPQFASRRAPSSTICMPPARARPRPGGPGCGDQGQGFDRHLAGRSPCGPDRVQRPVRRFDPDHHGPGPLHHLRPDGRDQHGPRRNADDRRICHPDGAVDLHRRPAPGPDALLLPPRCGGWVRRRCSSRLADRNDRHPPPVRPSAGDPAGDLGHQLPAHPDRAHHLRRQPCGHGAGLAGRRVGTGDQSGPALQPAVHHQPDRDLDRRGLAAADPHPPWPAGARHHPEPAHRLQPGCQHPRD